MSPSHDLAQRIAANLAANVAASLGARSRFDPAQHLRLTVDGLQVGWLPRRHAQTLRELEGTEGIGFAVLGTEADDTAVLLPRIHGFDARTAALGTLARRLAAHNLLRGWRDEAFAVTPALDHPALATIERAAARYFGLLTFASHMNGIVAGQRALWIARRSDSKAVDPGMWDNLVAGGMPHGSDPLATLVRECDEESGIPPWLAAQAQAHGTVQVLREIDEGVQWETVYLYDLELPADFVPHNRDGEVAEHRRVGPDAALAIMADGAMTLDATLVTLCALRRRGWAPPVPGFAD